jgi:hypothetical protein
MTGTLDILRRLAFGSRFNLSNFASPEAQPIKSEMSFASHLDRAVDLAYEVQRHPAVSYCQTAVHAALMNHNPS